MTNSKRRERKRPQQAVSDLAAWQIATLLFLVGLGCLYVSAKCEGPHGPGPFDLTLREVGALFLVTGAVSVFWDLRGRRALSEEVLSAANLASDVKSAGLVRIPTRYLEIDWGSHLESAREVDLFFAYANTWRNTYASHLRSLVARDGTCLRVVLPDIEDDALMEQLAAKFRYAADELRELIRKAEDDVDNLSRQASKRSRVERRRTSEFPVFTYYRFDRACVSVLYSQAPGRVEVPAFESVAGGRFYSFFAKQFEVLWAEGESVRPVADH